MIAPQTYKVALQVQVDAIGRLQVESAAEVEALLAAILDRLFKGRTLE